MTGQIADDEWVDVPRPQAATPHPAPPEAHADDEWVDVPRPSAGDGEYRNMPWSEVGSRAMSSLPRSAWENLTAIPQAVMHPSDTAHGISELAGGVKSKVAGLFTDQDPEKKAKDERVFDQAFGPYTDAAPTWMGGKGDTTRLKKAVAEDPFAVASMATLPLSGGAGLLGKGAQIAGEASALGKAANLGSKAASAAAVVADPAGWAASKAPALAKTVDKGIKHGFAGATGVPQEAFTTAYEVGKLAPDDIRRQLFESFATGNGDTVAFSSSARKALDKITSEAMEAYGKSHEAMMGAATKPVDMSTFFNTMAESERKLGNKKYSLVPEANDLIDSLRSNIMTRVADGMDGASAVQIDALKRQLYQKMAEVNPNSPLHAVYKDAFNGVRDSLKQSVPEYMKHMEGYTTLLDDLTNIEKKMGTGDRVGASAEFARAIRAAKTPDGAKILERMTEHSPELPYMLHGSLLHNGTASGGAGLFELGSGIAHMGGIGAELLSGHPVAALGHAGIATAQGIAQSPSIIGGAAKTAGKVAGGINGFTSAIPLGDATKSAVKKAASAVKPVAQPAVRAESAFEQNKKRKQFDVQFAEKRGGRIGRQAGGRIARALTADQLISGLERSRNRQKKKTEPILNKSDEAVVRALSIANQHI